MAVTSGNKLKVTNRNNTALGCTSKLFQKGEFNVRKELLF